MTDVDDIARKYARGAYTMRHALWLVSQRIGATDAWTPIVVLGEATRRVMGWDR